MGTVTVNAITGTYNLLSGSVQQLQTPSAFRAVDDLGPVPGTAGLGSFPSISTAIGTLALMASTGGSGLTDLGTTFAPGVYDFGAGSLGAGKTLCAPRHLADSALRKIGSHLAMG